MILYIFVRHYIKKASIAAVFIASLFLAGCPTLTQPPEKDYSASAPATFYIQQANQSVGAEKIDWQILAARAYLRENNLIRAKELLSRLPQSLGDNQTIEAMLTISELQALQKNVKAANTALNKIHVDSLNNNQLIRYYQISANLATDPLSQLRLYEKLEGMPATPEQQQSILEDTWRLLSSIPESSLQRMTINSDENTLKGWIDLAIVYQQSKHDIALLQSEIRGWQTRYPSNPFIYNFPARLSGLADFRSLDITNIAMLLPMGEQTKAFSQAIHAGFTAAMTEDNINYLSVEIFDTSTQSVASILNQLSSQQSTLVIGPLLKNEVEQAISNSSQLNILALNTPENIIVKNNICYFGLSPENEAREAAKMLSKEYKQVPLLIIPQNSFGRRVAMAFDQEWNQLGGGTTLVKYFGSINELKNAVNHNSNLSVEGEPLYPDRPIPDGKIDSIYIVATQSELTLIKAMLEMKVASRTRADLYASSRSHQPTGGPDFRLEMEGLKFSEIPLLAGSDRFLLQKALAEYKNDYAQIRLYALGMDAWNVAKSMSELRQIPDFRIQGHTGILSADSTCTINRQLTWLKYQKGRLVAVEQNLVEQPIIGQAIIE